VVLHLLGNNAQTEYSEAGREGIGPGGSEKGIVEAEFGSHSHSTGANT
jgi:hypothetical protein